MADNPEKQGESFAKEIIDRFFIEARRERKFKYFRIIVFSLIMLFSLSVVSFVSSKSKDILSEDIFRSKPIVEWSKYATYKRTDKSNDTKELVASQRATIMVLPIRGVIQGDPLQNHLRTSDLFGDDSINMVLLVRDALTIMHKSHNAEKISRLVLYIDSPGGTVTASNEIYNLLREWKQETGVKVIAYFHGVATSGAYYIAQAADEIVADRTSITGSIGVIFSSLNYAGLAEWIGVKEETIKSGKFKDMGSSFRAMTLEEKEIFQGLIDESYEQFLSTIAEGRRGKLTKTEIRKLADGRIFSGKQAAAIKLADNTTGTFVDLLRKEAEQIRKEMPQVQEVSVIACTPKNSSILDRITSRLLFFSAELPFEDMKNKSQLLYLWPGGI